MNRRIAGEWFDKLTMSGIVIGIDLAPALGLTPAPCYGPGGLLHCKPKVGTA